MRSRLRWMCSFPRDCKLVIFSHYYPWRWFFYKELFLINSLVFLESHPYGEGEMCVWRLASISFQHQDFFPPMSFWSYRFHVLCVLWGLVQKIFFLILTWGLLWPGPSSQVPVSTGMSQWCPGLISDSSCPAPQHPLPWGARVPLTGKWCHSLGVKGATWLSVFSVDRSGKYC